MFAKLIAEIEALANTAFGQAFIALLLSYLTPTTTQTLERLTHNRNEKH